MKSKKRGVGLKITLVFVVILFACLAYNECSRLNEETKEIEKYNTLKVQEEERSKELDKISKECDSLEAKEKNARALGYVKPNEKIFKNYNDKK